MASCIAQSENSYSYSYSYSLAALLDVSLHEVHHRDHLLLEQAGQGLSLRHQEPNYALVDSFTVDLLDLLLPEQIVYLTETKRKILRGRVNKKWKGKRKKKIMKGKKKIK